jgi:hypothetical protein
MVHRIADGNRVDVDFLFAQRIANARQSAGTILEEQRQLLCDLHNPAKKLAEHSSAATRFWAEGIGTAKHTNYTKVLFACLTVAFFTK